MPATINPVDNNLIRIDSFDASSPKKPPQIFVIPILYINVNKTLEAETVVTREAGPRDNAQSNVISPNWAVMNSFINTNNSAGLRFEKYDLTSAQESFLNAKQRNIRPSANILKPCV